MNNKIYNSNRPFTLYDYSVSHGLLLLRSDKRKGFDENIDIIFYDTGFIQIPAFLNDIDISKSENKEDILYPSLDKYFSRDENNLFKIISSEENFYIAASFVRVFENELDHNESGLNTSLVKEMKEIANSFTK